jgi:hypothetical protein
MPVRSPPKEENSMASGTYRGVVRGGKVVFLDEQPPLDEGTEVLVTPRPGTPAAVVAAAESSPKVPVEWVDELDRLIAEGQRPPARPDPFRDEAGSQESQ